jgi:cytochrome c oxidase cbb3-type subunit III
MHFRILFVCLAAGLAGTFPVYAQHPVPKTASPDTATAERGRVQFQSNCGFCHGNDARGSRAPDLIRSAILSHDENGNLITPVIRNGRPEHGMPAFPSLSDAQVSDVVAFLHHTAGEALHSARVPEDYPLKKLLTGDAGAGKAYFNGAGGCSGCHSVTGDLAKVADKYSPIDLQQHMVYPAKEVKRTAVVKLQNGETYEGTLVHSDEFNVAITGKDGWYHSWPRSQATVEIHDPLKAHRELMKKHTDADIHNLFAYLESLKK